MKLGIHFVRSMAQNTSQELTRLPEWSKPDDMKNNILPIDTRYLHLAYITVACNVIFTLCYGTDYVLFWSKCSYWKLDSEYGSSRWKPKGNSQVSAGNTRSNLNIGVMNIHTYSCGEFPSTGNNIREEILGNLVHSVKTLQNTVTFG